MPWQPAGFKTLTKVHSRSHLLDSKNTFCSTTAWKTSHPQARAAGTARCGDGLATEASRVTVGDADSQQRRRPWPPRRLGTEPLSWSPGADRCCSAVTGGPRSRGGRRAAVRPASSQQEARLTAVSADAGLLTWFCRLLVIGRKAWRCFWLSRWAVGCSQRPVRRSRRCRRQPGTAPRPCPARAERRWP